MQESSHLDNITLVSTWHILDGRETNNYSYLQRFSHLVIPTKYQ
jgi:hypothetical protein